MSGIVGLWNLDGAPLDTSVLAKMSGTLRHRGPDGEGCRRIGPVGFACQQMWVTVEEIGEVQPLIGRGGVMLMMDGRLDNRDELHDVLKLPPTASDAAFALAAYEAWEDRFAERLNGDFALAAFDEPRRRLILARDSIGIRPLYYFQNDRLFAFASEIKALLAHPGIPALPDDEGLADFLLISSRPIDRQEITCFAGISALVPAHVAMITPERVATRRYWDFESGREVRFRSFDEYAEVFRGRFEEAVRRRIRAAHPVAISVSGGLDSSSIYCQAEQLVRSGIPNRPAIRGISYIGTHGTEADENKYLLEIERDYGVAIERFSIEPLAGLVQGAHGQIRATEAPMIDYSWGVTREQHQRAAAGGSRVFLTGHWGDQVLFSSAYLVDLFRSLAWRKIRRHTQEYVRWFGPTEGRMLSRRFFVDVARHHLPRPLVPPFKWVRRRLFGVERSKPWFSDAFLRRALRFANRPATIGTGFRSAQARAIYFEARSKYHVHCLEWHNKIGSLHGVDAAFPMLDRDLIAFLMAIPGEIQNWNGVPRAILREAMRGILPEQIRTRRSKGDFSGIVNRGVAQDVPAIRQALSLGSHGLRLGYFDATRLGPALTSLSAGLTRRECWDSWDLADLFGLEVWLQVFSTARGESQAPQSTR